MSRTFNESSLLIATHNSGKLAEMRALFAPMGITVSGAADHGLPEPEETGTTFVENARLKARAAVEATGLPALADDSGIEVDALDGAPGVYTADWAETETGRDFRLAMERTNRELEARDAAYPRTARFLLHARLGLARRTRRSRERPFEWSSGLAHARRRRSRL